MKTNLVLITIYAIIICYASSKYKPFGPTKETKCGNVDGKLPNYSTSKTHITPIYDLAIHFDSGEKKVITVDATTYFYSKVNERICLSILNEDKMGRKSNFIGLYIIGSIWLILIIMSFFNRKEEDWV